MTREQLIKHWDVIQAFKEGKEIQFREIGEKLWEDPTGVANFDFYLNYEYRVKPEEPKTILETSIDGITWYEVGKAPAEFNYKLKTVRRRIIGEEKPNQIKRLPTIEEVEKWFMENRVFKSKDGALSRIMTVDTDGLPIYIDSDYISIKRFCADYTHIDGSELYITENEKQTYGGEIADFPIEVVERMLECQVEQGNKRDVSVFELKKSAEKVDGGFYWGSTKERGYFWCKVIDDKNFYLFFQKYPKKQ